MNTKLMAAFAVMAMLAICIMPMSDVDAVYTDVDGETVVGTDKDADYDIIYTNHDYDDRENLSMSVEYSAKLVDSRGETVSNGVSPSSGSLDNGIAKTLTVSAPKDVGTYRLVVSYEPTVTYTDEDGETVEVPEEDLQREESISIKVVAPITMKITLKNDSNTDLSGFGVYFFVNGEKIEDSYTTVDLAKDGTATISYEYIADLGNGEYRYHVEPADSGQLIKIEGLETEHTFYIGDNSYSMWTALLVIVIVLLALIMLWVYRKPVKNYGKPKSRR